jgi:hypothetical protein
MIETIYGEEAKNKIKNMHGPMVNPFIHQWLNEKNQVFSVLKYDKNIDADFPVCYALLHKLDYDPCGEHKNPILLDYIYTHPLFRRQGHARNIVNKLTKNNSITACCSSDASSELFSKCNFKIINSIIARHP